MKLNVKDHIKGKVTFQFYRDGNLFYKTDSGFLFQVPITDVGNATFSREDKAILFMRWIRKHVETLNLSSEEFANYGIMNGETRLAGCEPMTAEIIEEQVERIKKITGTT